MTEAELNHIEAVTAFTVAMSHHEKTGDHAYLMMAWSAWRKAVQLQPEYEAALLARVGGLSVNQSAAIERREQLFVAFDRLAESIEPKPRSVQAIQADRVVEAMRRAIFNAESVVQMWKAGQTKRKHKPPVTKNHLYKIASAATGESISNVRKIWDAWVGEQGYSYGVQRRIDALKSAKKKSTKKPRDSHPWKRD